MYKNLLNDLCIFCGDFDPETIIVDGVHHVNYKKLIDENIFKDNSFDVAYKLYKEIDHLLKNHPDPYGFIAPEINYVEESKPENVKKILEYIYERAKKIVDESIDWKKETIVRKYINSKIAVGEKSYYMVGTFIQKSYYYENVLPKLVVGDIKLTKSGLNFIDEYMSIVSFIADIEKFNKNSSQKKLSPEFIVAGVVESNTDVSLPLEV